MKSSFKRALVAISMTVASLGAMFAIAAPAAHALTPWFSDSYTSDWGTVSVSFSYDSNNNNAVYEDVTVSNVTLDGAHCVEGWVDPYLERHRPANPFTVCSLRGLSSYDSGPLEMHWPRSDSFYPGGYIDKTGFTSTAHSKLAVCDVDVRPQRFGTYNAGFDRRYDGGGAPCEQYSGHAVGAITNASYDQLSWQDMQNIPCSGCGTDMRPEYVNRGFIDLLGSSQSLFNNDQIVSFDASHRLALQSVDGGNVVLYKGDTIPWAASWCYTTGHSNHAGSHLTMQGSDGNLVLYQSGGGAATWADANSSLTKSPCTLGSYGGSTPYLIMQTDGNMVVYPYAGGSALWSTGTNGQ